MLMSNQLGACKMEKGVDVTDGNQPVLALAFLVHAPPRFRRFWGKGIRGSAMPLGMPDKNVPLVFRRL